jgi:lycopene cyclase domain-containing protein
VSGHGTYLLLELVWAVPVLALHWAFGASALWRRRGAILLATLIPTAYLSLADAVAIHSGIWAISPARTLDLRAGSLVLEEVIFFLLSNLMVVQSLVLILDSDARELALRRLRRLLPLRR